MRESIRSQRKELEEYSKNLEGKVAERTMELEKSKEELEGKNRELERFNKLTVGREMKMIELKKKIARLEGKSVEGEDFSE